MMIVDNLERVFPNTIEGRKLSDTYIRLCKAACTYRGHKEDTNTIIVKTQSCYIEEED